MTFNNYWVRKVAFQIFDTNSDGMISWKEVQDSLIARSRRIIAKIAAFPIKIDREAGDRFKQDPGFEQLAASLGISLSFSQYIVSQQRVLADAVVKNGNERIEWCGKEWAAFIRQKVTQSSQSYPVDFTTWATSR